MKFWKSKKAADTTIRKVTDDEKHITYGMVGLIDDFIAVDVLIPEEGELHEPGDWIFIPEDGDIEKAGLGTSREAAIADARL